MNTVNEYGCSIYNQNGQESIQGFDSILANLSPELRAMFEKERLEAQQQFDSYVAENGYNT